MVIVGYQGIGKSTLANKSGGFIDLESGNFFIDGYRQDNWYIPYCNIAISLSEQGYDVFVSSHKCVRNYLIEHCANNRLVIICPNVSLRDNWVKKLEDRYIVTRKNKDYKAWKNAAALYYENIQDLINHYGFDVIIINDMNYNLEELIAAYKTTYGGT